jgi:hypothetical protein
MGFKTLTIVAEPNQFYHISCVEHMLDLVPLLGARQLRTINGSVSYEI